MAAIIQTDKLTFTPLRGEPLYYCYRKILNHTTELLMALECFQSQIRSTTERYHEAGVAAKKLEWWEQEIDQLYNNASSHPITRKLQPYLSQFAIQKNTFKDFLYAHQLLLFGQSFKDHDTLLKYIDETFLPLETIKAQLLLNQEITDSQTRWLKHATRINELIHRIDQLPHHIQRDIFTLPNITEQHSEMHMARQQVEQNLEQVCQDLIKIIELEKHGLLKHSTHSKDLKGLKPLHIKHKIYLATLSKICRNKCSVLTIQQRISPLKMVLLSF